MFKLSPLTQSIRKILALSGLSLLSFSGKPNDALDPKEIRYNPGEIKGVCSQDAEQDGDLDLFFVYENQIYEQQISIIINAGTPESPNFLPPQPIYNIEDRAILNSTSTQLSQLGLTNCRLTNPFKQLVDIDADGDLDLFTRSHSKKVPGLLFSRNEGTNEKPHYIREDRPEFSEISAEKSIAKNFMFEDFDNDGDFDFFNHLDKSETTETVFFENIGTPQEPMFQRREQSPLQFLCENYDSASRSINISFLADIDNDRQLEIMCIDRYRSELTLLDQDASGSLPDQILIPPSHSAEPKFLQALDIDDDGDIDILNGVFTPYFNQDIDILKQGHNLYLNTGNNQIPHFQYLIVPDAIKAPIALDNRFGQFADLDGDNDFDYINVSDDNKRIEYAINIGSNSHPVFNKNTFPPEFESCNANLQSIGDHKFAFNDIDGDGDQDFFTKLSKEGTGDTMLFCENIGDPYTPIFSSVSKNPFGLSDSERRKIIFGDLDGDGDQDLWSDEFFENTGGPAIPHFQQTTQIPLYGRYEDFLDLNKDGRIESAVTSNSVLINELEPATAIAATVVGDSPSSSGDLIIAINRPSRLTLFSCDPDSSFCTKRLTVSPHAAQAISINKGNLYNNSKDQIVLATIDKQGRVNIEIFWENLNLINSNKIGLANSVSVKTGQVDSDSEDEYIITLVQEDGRVAAIGYNVDGSLVGKIVANTGKQPQFTMGESPLSGLPYFALTYLTSDGQIETMTFSHDATPLATHRGGAASQVGVFSMDLTPDYPGDEFITSLVQPDGRAALIAFSAGGKELGKVIGGISQHPKVLSGHFPHKSITGLTVSLIREDKKPALYFLNKQGNVLAEGVGYTEAIMTDHVMIDVNRDGIEEGILVYIDKAGIPRWEIFDFQGNKK